MKKTRGDCHGPFLLCAQGVTFFHNRIGVYFHGLLLDELCHNACVGLFIDLDAVIPRIEPGIGSDERRLIVHPISLQELVNLSTHGGAL